MKLTQEQKEKIYKVFPVFSAQPLGKNINGYWFGGNGFLLRGIINPKKVIAEFKFKKCKF